MASYELSTSGTISIPLEFGLTVEKRDLQSTNETETDESSNANDFNDSNVLRDSVLIYGSITIILIIAFSWLRRKFPRVYNVRSWVEDLKSSLAEDQYQFFSWLWKVYIITDDEIMHECGLDAACFVRLIQMGYRLSVVGIFNMIWLLPIYYTAEAPSDSSEDVSDSVVKTTIANVPSGSHRLYATVFASYVLFGYTMHQILHEFQWYIEMRHKFLRKPLARHFAVFVRNIPAEYRTNASLEAFFRGCFSAHDIIEARLAVNVPNLAKVVAQREATVANLEHALALFEKEGIRPHHKDTLGVLGDNVDSIDYYTSQLEEQNKDVAQRIDAMENVLYGSTEVTNEVLASSSNPGICVDDNMDHERPEVVNEENLENEKTPVDTNFNEASPNSHEQGDSVRRTSGYHRKLYGMGKKLTDHANMAAGAAANTATGVAKNAANVATGAAKNAANVATGVAKNAFTLVVGGDDGEIFPAGFVVFSKLSTTNAALQMVHHDIPFSMEVLEAPDPEDVFWFNASRTNKDIQLGKLASLGMTAGLCLLWTIPISFFASLSNASAVRQDVGWLDDLFDKYPGLVPLTEQLAPLLVVGFNALLPMILEAISLFEGPISSGVVEASKFLKLAAFNIIQTFFVSAISGGVINALSNILDDWTLLVDLLATSLPAQGTYFMQILLASTATSAGMEMLRLVPIGMAVLRSKIGPNLTEKERSKAYFGLRPLNIPPDFEHADFTAQLVLYFMVLFVYCVISPMTSLITCVCFLFLGAMFRNQFIYIYGKHPDSGGKLWANFIQIMMTCILIAEVTILGLLGLKKAVKQIPLYIPLLVITILFNFYIRQMHFRVASYLPTRECLKADLKRGDNFDFDFVHDAYLQPALAAKKNVQPEQSSLHQSPCEHDEIVNDDSVKNDSSSFESCQEQEQSQQF